MKPLCAISVLLILLFHPLYLLAHGGSLKGSVVDSVTRKPIEGAVIRLPELSMSSSTDITGGYFLSCIPKGNYKINISCIGYEMKTIPVTVGEGEAVSLITCLPPAQVRISEVQVSAKKETGFSSLSGLDLKLRPVNTAQDMLKIVPGLFIAQHAGGGKAEQIFLRGFDLDHGTDINIAVDGMPVNMVSHAHGQGYADLHFVIPELVDKIDFGKGPYRADKGNLATTGYVDLKTTSFLNRSFIKMESGNFGHFRTVTAIDLNGKRTEGRDAYLAGEYSRDRGYFEAPQNFNRLNLLGKFSKMLPGNKFISLGISAFRSNWDASGQIPERAVAKGLITRFGELAKGEGGNTSRYNVNLQFLNPIDDKRQLKGNVYLCYYDFELYSNFTFFLNDRVNGDQIRQKEKRIVAGYNTAYTQEYKLTGINAKLEAGAGLRYDNVMNDELSHTKDRITTLSALAFGDINETNIYGYAGNTLCFSSRLSVNTALRYDHFVHDYYNKLSPAYDRQSYNTGALTPKVNIGYKINEDAKLYVSYGMGFHSNDTRVVVAQKGKGVLPLAHAADAGIVIKPFSKLYLSPAIWWMDMQNEFVYVGDEAIVENVGRTRRVGADLSARYQLLRWLYIDGDANYTHARLRNAEDGQNYVPLAASFTAAGGVTAKFKNGLSAALRFRHISDRPANEDYTATAHGYTLFDGTASYTHGSFELGIQLQNILNADWNEAQFETTTRLANERVPVSEIHFTPGTPRAFRATVAFMF